MNKTFITTLKNKKEKKVEMCVYCSVKEFECYEWILR